MTISHDLDVDLSVTFVIFQTKSISTYLVWCDNYFRNAWILSKHYKDVCYINITDKFDSDLSVTLGTF